MGWSISSGLETGVLYRPPVLTKREDWKLGERWQKSYMFWNGPQGKPGLWAEVSKHSLLPDDLERRVPDPGGMSYVAALVRLKDSL